MPNAIIISTVNNRGIEMEVAVFPGYMNEGENKEKVLECTIETLSKAMSGTKTAFKNIERVRVTQVTILRNFKTESQPTPKDVALVKNIRDLSVAHALAVESIDYFLDKIREEHLT